MIIIIVVTCEHTLRRDDSAEHLLVGQVDNSKPYVR